jgi:hypothetical protein
LPGDDVKAFARDMARAAADRQLAVLALTADEAFARALGGIVLMHKPATGNLRRRSLWRIFTNPL